jgi:hypothetical protein
MNLLFTLKKLKIIETLMCMVFCTFASTFYAAKEGKKISLSTTSFQRFDHHLERQSAKPSLDLDDEEIKEFEQIQKTDELIATFIENIKNNKFEEVKTFIKDTSLTHQLDQVSAQAAVRSAKNAALRKLLCANQIISLLHGPNGPLVEALLKSKNLGLIQQRQAVLNHLFETVELYKWLDSEKKMGALFAAINSEFSSLIIPLLLRSEFVIKKITPEQGQFLLFKAAAKEDQKTIAGFFDSKEIGNPKALHKILGSEEKFFKAALILPLTQTSSFSKEEQFAALAELLKNEIFLKNLVESLKSYEIFHQLAQVFLYAAATKAENTKTLAKEIATKFITFPEICCFLATLTLATAWENADESLQQIIHKEIERREPASSQPTFHRQKKNPVCNCALMSPTAEEALTSEPVQNLIAEIVSVLDEEDKKINKNVAK